MARTISWSGYTWDVRPAGFGGPGPNQWSDSEANVRLDGTDLVLSIVKDTSGTWTSAEVDNQQHLGYGTYRWVVESDLSALDANEVLGMFTYGGPSPSNNEIDIEPSHWGNLAWPTGSATVWQDADAGRNESRSFDYSNRPPYVNQFTWLPGVIHYVVTDAAGATLLDWTVTSGVPTPSSDVPVVNYWRYDGVPPAGVRSMRIASFAWAPPGHEGDLGPPSTAAGGAAPPAQGASATSATGSPVGDRCAVAGADASGAPAPQVRLTMRPNRFAVTGRRRGTSIAWTASGSAKLRLVVERRQRNRFLTVGSVTRAVRAGAGRMRFAGTVGGRRLRPGRYRLVVTFAAAGHPRCAPQKIPFTVLRG